ncbi:MAG: Uma2 family endonuclease [Stenomitos frigidus ULC029]
MTAALIQSPDRVLLRDISWQTYQSLLKDFEQQPGMRLTYDRGLLEIMMPLVPHETYKKLLGRLIETLTEELEIEIRSLGSLTCDREDLARGLEPDQCYYIQNEAAVRHRERIDLTQDPPPDLAIEVDITSSSIDQLAIYAALGVPEVWRYDGQTLTMYHLKEGGYESRDRSLSLPQLTAAEVVRFLALSQTMGETSLVRQFRQWVNQLR